MKTPFHLLLLLAGLLVAGCSTVSSSLPLQYQDADTGLAISLPASWKGFSVLHERWDGSPSVPRIVIRHPKWSAKDPYQDIPIYIVTLKQWVAMGRGEFTLHAGGMDDELYRNSQYVFVIHNRDFADDLKGDGEVGEILRNVSAHHPEVVENGS